MSHLLRELDRTLMHNGLTGPSGFPRAQSMEREHPQVPLCSRGTQKGPRPSLGMKAAVETRGTQNEPCGLDAGSPSRPENISSGDTQWGPTPKTKGQIPTLAEFTGSDNIERKVETVCVRLGKSFNVSSKFHQIVLLSTHIPLLRHSKMETCPIKGRGPCFRSRHGEKESKPM